MTELALNVGIWRYMDLARFLALIYNREIYFARLAELGEPWEGAWSPSDPIFGGDREFKKLIVSNLNEDALVSCWHENEVESVAMWGLYVSGKEGVAVKSTVGRLGRFASAGRELKISRMEYRHISDHGGRPTVLLFEAGGFQGSSGVRNMERSVFRKNRSYAHEREIRALIYADYYSAEQAEWAAASRVATPCGDHTDRTRGQTIMGDPSLLIERIVLSPRFPSSAIGTLQRLVESAGIAAKVESSELLSRPETEDNAAAHSAATPTAEYT